MGQVHHGSATTTAAIRRAIQHSQESLRRLSRRYGINPKTVAKWKKRGSVADLPTGPKEAKSTVLSVEDEAIVVAYRRHTLLPLDDCLYALQPTIPHLTRSSLHRCLQRHGGSNAERISADAIDLYQASTTRAQQAVRGCCFAKPVSIDTRGETHRSNYLKSIGREAPCFGMLSLVSRQLFLWQQALFPMTRSLAVAEAAGGLGAFMVAGLAPPTSGAGLMCHAPSQAVR